MRHRVAAITMALGVTIAGNALAADATRVIYDLTALRASPAATSALGAQREGPAPTMSLPISTPSLGERGSWEDGTGVGDLESARRPHGSWTGTTAGLPRHGRQTPSGQTQPGRDPSPTPEPGSLLLLAGALATGMRYRRRR